MAYKGTLIKPDHVSLAWWNDPNTTDADREDAIDEAYNMKLHAEYIAAAEHEKYIDESEVTEWGPNGQPSAKKQLEIYNKSLKKSEIKTDKKNAKGNKITKPTPPPILRYPYEGMTQHTDYLQIDIVEYKPAGRESTGKVTRKFTKEAKEHAKKNKIDLSKERTTFVETASSFIGKMGARRNTGNRLVGRTRSYALSTRPLKNEGTILLPIPSNVQDGNSVKVGDNSLNGLQAAGATAIKDSMNIELDAGMSGIADQFAKGMADFKTATIAGTNLDTVKDLALNKLTASALGIFGGNVTVNQLMARQTGNIINPNMELLFDGPTLRAFKFQFKMTPRNRNEAEQIRLIIRAFKRNMAPKAEGGGKEKESSWFLKTPNVFELRYRTGNKDHNYLHKFKQCFLTDVAVNYTGDGVYSTYEDGSPVSYLMDLSFKELEPIYDIDYDSTEGQHSVGY